MADSDHSTSLSFVTRRRLLAGTGLAALAYPFKSKGQEVAPHIGHDIPDPALLAWQEWKTAALKTEELCQKQQRLETKLARDIGFPRATFCPLEGGESLTICSPDDIERICGSDPDIADLRAKAERELAVHQARWDAADELIGYSATKRAEMEAGEREHDLVDILTDTPATTLAGVAGKLDMIIHEGEIWEDDTEFPQPQIRSALRDLIRMTQVMEPNVFMPGSDRRGLFSPQTLGGPLGADSLILPL